jgi:hypothetical protein
MQLARSNLANLCRQFGQHLKLPPGIDGPQLLWAIAGDESSFGADISPRHEAAYCHGGKYFDAVRTKMWGCLAHCSYGPWQLMFANIAPGIGPDELLRSPASTAFGVTQLIQSRIIRAQGAKTLAEIGEAYNTGKIQPDPDYVAKLTKNYAVPLGALA